MALAWLGVRSIVAATPQWLSRVQHIELDASALVFTIAVSLLTGVLFGLVPMLSVSTASLVTPLKASARVVARGRGHRRVQGALVVAQVALTLVLLLGAGLLIKSFWQLQRVNLGLDANRVVWFQTRVPANKGFRQVGNQNGFVQLEVSPVPAQLFDRVRDRLREIPGVESVAGTNAPLVSGATMQAPFRIEGRPMEGGPGPAAGFATRATDPFVNYSLVTPDFFKTIRVQVIRGREFTARDTLDSSPVAIVNEAMARRFWPGENPIGQRVTVTIVPGEQPREVIGIVGDTPTSRWDRSAAPGLYVPHLQESLRSRVPYGQSRVGMVFMLRINQPLSSIVPGLRRTVAEVDPSLPVTQVEMMDEYFARQVNAPRDSMVLVGIFGVVALLLAVCGIYAIVAYGVVQRTHEIGIRMALGARRATVLGLVMRQSTDLDRRWPGARRGRRRDRDEVHEESAVRAHPARRADVLRDARALRGDRGGGVVPASTPRHQARSADGVTLRLSFTGSGFDSRLSGSRLTALGSRLWASAFGSGPWALAAGPESRIPTRSRIPDPRLPREIVTIGFLQSQRREPRDE